MIDLDKEPEPKNIYSLKVRTVIQGRKKIRKNEAKMKFFETIQISFGHFSLSAAEPGMGKTSSLALVALEWVEGKIFRFPHNSSSK